MIKSPNRDVFVQSVLPGWITFRNVIAQWHFLVCKGLDSYFPPNFLMITCSNMNSSLFFFNAFSSHANMHRLYSRVSNTGNEAIALYLYNKCFVQTVCLTSDFHASRIQLPRTLLQMKDFPRKRYLFFALQSVTLANLVSYLFICSCKDQTF